MWKNLKRGGSEEQGRRKRSTCLSAKKKKKSGAPLVEVKVGRGKQLQSSKRAAKSARTVMKKEWNCLGKEKKKSQEHHWNSTKGGGGAKNLHSKEHSKKRGRVHARKMGTIEPPKK